MPTSKDHVLAPEALTSAAMRQNKKAARKSGSVQSDSISAEDGPRVGRAMSGLYQLLIAGGLFSTGTLWLGHALNLSVPCGESSGCDAVAASPAAQFRGIPIALFGFLAYLLVAGAMYLGREKRVRAMAAAATLISGAGCAVSLYLTNLSITVVHALCAWCLTSAAIMTGLFMMNASNLALGAIVERPGRRFVAALTVAIVLGLGGMGGWMVHAGARPPLSAAALAKVTKEEACDSRNSLGPADAPITVVEFSDMTCPLCRTLHEPMKKFQSHNPAGVRWVYRNRPLIRKAGHELSGAAAKLSEIAADKGKFWDFTEQFYAVKGRATLDAMIDLTAGLGFNRAVVKKRLADPKDPAQARAERDLDLAEKWKIETTPTFLVFVQGQPTVAAQANTIQAALTTPAVEQALAEARSGHPQK